MERHPFPPFIPRDAKILIMGTFPPKPNRWSMEFYYPNKTNDFWRIMGLIFYGSAEHFRDPATGAFRQADIEAFLREKGIALHDTGAAVRRLKDNAADKFLEIVEPVNLSALLREMPDCHYIATTGEKAAGVIAELTSTPLPKIGEFITTTYPSLSAPSSPSLSAPSSITPSPSAPTSPSEKSERSEKSESSDLSDSPTSLPPRLLHITRMPSTSRAYPLKLEKKAESYRHLFIQSGILDC